MGAQRCAGTELAVYLPLEETNRQLADAYGLSSVSSATTTIEPGTRVEPTRAELAEDWLLDRVGLRPGPGQRLGDPVHRRQRPARHPRHARGGPRRRAVGHLLARGLRRARGPGHRPGQRAGLAVVGVMVDGVRLDVQSCEVVEHERALDFRHGVLWRRTVFADRQGRRTQLESLRFASFADRRLVCTARRGHPARPRRRGRRDQRALDGRRRNLERLPVYPPGHRLPARGPLGEVGAVQASGPR